MACSLLEDQVIDAMDKTRATHRDDAAIEAAVLRQLLALYPVQLTLEEIVREVAGEPEEFALRDAVERAVRELRAVGLVHRSGEMILPSRASLRFDALLG
jgi:predicted transcriptional regulator with HTH domain